MTDRNILIGNVVNGVLQHQQGQWTPGSDRLVDPDNRQLALTSEVTAAAEGIQGAVDTYAQLPDPTTLGVGTIYIVRQDTDAPSGNGLYRVAEDQSTQVWVYLDGLNFQDASEVPYSNSASGLTAVTAQAAIDEVDDTVDALDLAVQTLDGEIDTLTSAVNGKADEAYDDGSTGEGEDGEAVLDFNGTVSNDWGTSEAGNPHELITDTSRDPDVPTNMVGYLEWAAEFMDPNAAVVLEMATTQVDGPVSAVTVHAYCEGSGDIDAALAVGEGSYGAAQFVLDAGGAAGWRSVTFNAASDPGLFPMNQSDLDGLRVRFRGNTRNTPETQLSILYAAYSEVTYSAGSAWADDAPATLKLAIDRLATQVAAHLGGTIPA